MTETSGARRGRAPGRAAVRTGLVLLAVLLTALPGTGHGATAATLFGMTLTGTNLPGGTTVPGEVTLTAPAPAAGAQVALSASSGTATVPPTVTVAEGADRATFTVATSAVTSPQAVTVTAAAGGVSRSAVLRLVAAFPASKGSVSLARGGTGQGRVTSQPAGIDCLFLTSGPRTTTSGTCGNAWFAAGTQVRLDARATAGSAFRGWEFETSCRDAPKVVVQRDVAHICRPGFQSK